MDRYVMIWLKVQTRGETGPLCVSRGCNLTLRYKEKKNCLNLYDLSFTVYTSGIQQLLFAYPQM
jgi:hypothetical protein